MLMLTEKVLNSGQFFIFLGFLFSFFFFVWLFWWGGGVVFGFEIVFVISARAASELD